MGKKKTQRTTAKDEGPRTFEMSSGNIFYDIGLADYTEIYVRSLLASTVVKILQKKGLLKSKKKAASTKKAAAALEANQAQISNLVGGRSRDFSLDQLIRYIHRLGGVLNVTVDVHDEPQEPPIHLTIED